MTQKSGDGPASVTRDSIDAFQRAISLVPTAVIDHVLALLLEARAGRRRVYIMGNGGSAATASHMAADLAKTAQVEGFDPLRAYALTDNVPLLTAWSNDASYAVNFAAQIEAQVDPGDVVIAITASGNSANVVAGLRAAKERGATTVGLLGLDGGEALGMVDIAVHIPCREKRLLGALHLAISDALTAGIRAHLECIPVPTQLSPSISSDNFT